MVPQDDDEDVADDVNDAAEDMKSKIDAFMCAHHPRLHLCTAPHRTVPPGRIGYRAD